MVVDANTEVRKLRPAELYNLGNILNPSDNWKKLMASVTKEGTDSAPKFPGEYITILEDAARQKDKFAALIFLEEWGTMGRNRPTLGLLLDLLMKAELFRAADYLALEILKVETPQRPMSCPAAPIDTESIAALLQQMDVVDVSESNDSNFCLRTTSEFPLREVNSMCIVDSEANTDDNNVVLDNNDVGVFEMQYAESKSNQVLDHAGTIKNPVSSFELEDKKEENLKKADTPKSSTDSIISDLIRFSASDISRNVRSDLIRFESEMECSNENVELHEAIFPDLNVLCPAATTISENGCKNLDADFSNSKIEDGKDVSSKEMCSTELPVFLKHFATAEKSPTGVVSQLSENTSYYHRELMSAELPLCINNRTGFISNESNLNDSEICNSEEDYSQENSEIVCTQSLTSEASMSGDVSCNNGSLKQIDAQMELPCVVAQASMRTLNEEKHERSVGYDNNVMNSQELPVTVLVFHKR